MTKAMEKATHAALNALSPLLNQMTNHLKFWEQQQSLMQASRDPIKNSDPLDINYEDTSINDMRLILKRCYQLGALLEKAEERRKPKLLKALQEASAKPKTT